MLNWLSFRSLLTQKKWSESTWNIILNWIFVFASFFDNIAKWAELWKINECIHTDEDANRKFRKERIFNRFSLKPTCATRCTQCTYSTEHWVTGKKTQINNIRKLNWNPKNGSWSQCSSLIHLFQWSKHPNFRMEYRITSQYRQLYLPQRSSIEYVRILCSVQLVRALH